MVLADIDLGELLLTMLWLFFLFMWIWVFIACFSDLFRDHDESGGKKVLWTIFMVLLPIFGPLVYLLVRGGGMAERAARQQAAAQAQFNEYVRQTAGTPQSTADELQKLADLKAAGSISDADYEAAKAKILS
jgi:ABC-type multidrug transport system fused ATPase/permease subunit